MSRYHKFQNLVQQEGLKTALWRTLSHISGREYLRTKLLVPPDSSIPHRIYSYSYRPLLERRVGSGINIMEQEWDNLILLDSYRADVFREKSSLDGEYESVVTSGNWSLEFIMRNFQGKEFHDTICITANPYYQRLDAAIFYKVIDTGSEDPQKAMEKTTTTAIDAHKKNPNKRLLIHYMPPHTPHMGKTSKQVRNSFGREYNLFEAYNNGLVSRDKLKKSYIETVRIIESEIVELIPQLNGKTVVSSDHGENLGERNHGLVQLAHGNETKECRIVPWLEMPYDKRRKVVEDTPVSNNSVDDSEVESRLEHLGYI